MPANVRFKFVLFIMSVIIEQSLSITCPSGSNWSTGPDGLCYTVLTQPTPFDNGVVDAEQLCIRNGSQLASLPNSTIEIFVANLLNSTQARSAWPVQFAYIGYTDAATMGNFTWTDNTTVTYSNLSSAELDKHFFLNDSRCVALYSPNGQWQTNRAWVVVPCCLPSNKTNAVVCSYAGPQSTPTSSKTIIQQYCNGGCPANYHSFGSSCFSVTINSTIYSSTYAARQSCLATGADLPTINSAETENFLKYVIASKAAQMGNTSVAVYIGLNAISPKRKWTQLIVTGTNYTNWSPGQPSTLYTPMPDNKTMDCAQMIWNQTTSSWMAASCCTPAGVSWVACQRPTSPPVSVPMANDVFASKCYAAFNECSSNPCYGNATCVNGITGRKCICPPGYSGNNCSIPACNSKPCRNNGSCVMTSAGYSCTCSSYYNGTNCETVINACYSYPCKYGATCTGSSSTSYTCNCVPGTKGTNCETIINQCINITCSNGGTCVNSIGYANCSCPENYGGERCEQLITCSTPSTPANSSINGTSGSTSPSPWPYQSYISFLCNPGLKFTDMNRRKTISCIKDPNTGSGNWNESLSDCGPHCDVLPSVGHAIVANGNTAVGNTVNFTCETGFIFSDNTTTVNSTCLPGRTWTNSLINTTCIIRQCPVLPIYPYQSLDTRQNTYNTTVTFWCDVGYVLFDNTTARTIKCLADGNWTAELPPCNPVKCPQLTAPAGVTTNTTNNTYMTYAKYSCNQNTRMLDGSTYRIILCDATAEWSDNITDCTSTRCFPLPYVANATPSTTDAEFWTVSTLTCIKGHRFMLGNNVELSSQSMTCQPNGWWSPILTYCQPILCPSVPQGANLTASTPSQLYGTVVNYKCKTGYYVDSVTRKNSHCIECLETKLWNDTNIPNCHPIVCPIPPDIVNGTRVLPNPVLYNYTAVITYTCDSGFRFIDGNNNKKITCTADGSWDDTDVSCRKDRCSPLNILPNSTPNTRNTTWYTNVTYSCNTGYEWPGNSTNHTIMCMAGGMWNNTFELTDDCVIKHCPPVMNMPNATVNSSTNVYNTYITYKCDTGFKYSDNSTIKTRWCSHTAKWVPETFPKCNIIHCPALGNVENATRDTNDTYYDKVVTFSCLPGYQFPDKSKQQQMVCTENGTWTDYPQPCQVVFCPPLPSWSEAVFNSTDNNFLSVVTYWCNDGYAFKGYSSAPGNGTVMSTKCLANKNWYPSILDCTSLTAINAAIAGKTYNSPQSVPIGTVACTIMCLVMFSVFLLDISKLTADFRLLRENLGKLLRGGRSNKISPSRP